MESTTPAQSVTDAQAASMEVAPPAGPADAKPPAPAPTSQTRHSQQKRNRRSSRSRQEPGPSASGIKNMISMKSPAKSPRKRCWNACGGARSKRTKIARTCGPTRTSPLVDHAGGALSAATRRRGRRAGTRRQPRLARLLAEFGDKILPEGFPFASIQLNYAYSAMHTDKSNDGPSAIIALGEFTGGELWTADRGVLPCRNELRLFNGNQPHCTLPFKGERYSRFIFRLPATTAWLLKMYNSAKRSGFCRLPTAPLSHV